MVVLSVFSIIILLSVLLTCKGYDGPQYLSLSSYNSSLIDRFISKLAHKHIVMIGDSLMRYQYLSLVYALHHHKFITDDMNPNFVIEHHWGHWGVYLNKTNDALIPEEYCDCYRNVPNTWAHWDPSHIIENRYYINTKYHINITFISFYGISVHGVWHNITDSNSLRQPRELFPESTHWSKDLPATIHWLKTIIPSDMKAILVLNTGMHPNYFFKGTYVNEYYCNSVRNAVMESNYDQFVWKTLSMCDGCFDHAHPDPQASTNGDKYMCSLKNVTCFHLGWTSYVNSSMRPDNAHFYPTIYNEMDRRMMDILI